MSATSTERFAFPSPCPTSTCRLRGCFATQKRIDVRPGEDPVVVQIGDHLFHKSRRQSAGAILVVQKVVEDRERQLLRTFALVGPFEPIFCEALGVIVLVQALAVDSYD